MRYLILLPFILLVFSCGDGAPDEQLEFAEKIESIQERYDEVDSSWGSGGNEMAQDLLCDELDELVETKLLTNWRGSVHDIVDSMIVGSWVDLKYDGITFRFNPKGSEWSKEEKQMIATLKGGDIIEFSGLIEAEISLTCNGKVKYPDLKVVQYNWKVL